MSPSDVFSQALSAPKAESPKPVFGFLVGASPQTPLGIFLGRSPGLLVGSGGGHPLPIPFPVDAFGVSISAPPRKILGYAFGRYTKEL